MKWTDDDLNLALQDLSQQDPPPAALAALRARVLDRAHRPRPRWWLWTPGPAATLALALLLWPQPPEIAPPPRLAFAPPVPEAAWVKTEKPQPPTLQPVAMPVKQTEFIRLFTSDPDVVILWSLESKGDEE